MVDSCAEGSGGADVVEEAGVHAVVLEAGPVGRAVGIDVALHGLATDKRIPDQTWEQAIKQQ